MRSYAAICLHRVESQTLRQINSFAGYAQRLKAEYQMMVTLSYLYQTKTDECHNVTSCTEQQWYEANNDSKSQNTNKLQYEANNKENDSGILHCIVFRWQQLCLLIVILLLRHLLIILLLMLWWHVLLVHISPFSPSRYLLFLFLVIVSITCVE